MLSTALRTNKHDGGSQLPGSGRAQGRPRGRALEKTSPHLKPVSPDPEAAEAAEAGLGDVAGLPLGRMPDGDEDATSGGAAGADGAADGGAADNAAPVTEPVLSDYSTIGAYLHELRRYPLMTREE